MYSQRAEKGKTSMSTIVATVFLVATLASLAYFAFLNSGDSETNFDAIETEQMPATIVDKNSIAFVDVSPIPPGAIIETFLIGNESDPSSPVELPLASAWSRTIRAPRPSGNIAIHHIYLTAVEEDLRVVPQFLLYNHHSMIKVDNWEWAGFAAEGEASFHSLPAPYARILKANSRVDITTMYVPLKSYALATQMKIFLNFTVVYTKLDNEDGTLNQEKLQEWIPVDMQLFGLYENAKGDFVVPGDGGKDSAYCRSVSLPWMMNNRRLVKAMGHIHIGAINLTMTDAETKEIVTIVGATFNEYGFVKQVGAPLVERPLIRGRRYIVTACYRNDRILKEAMGAFQLLHCDQNIPVPGLQR